MIDSMSDTTHHFSSLITPHHSHPSIHPPPPDFDKHVHRTKHRPLASGQLTPTHALAFLAAQLSVGLGVLVTFDQTCVALGLLSMPLVVAYPLCKRFTNWPQVMHLCCCCC
jgi:4-hydroxybenzoate polyprenyltransferase